MRRRTLGRTGIAASGIGFGGWAIGGSWGEQKDEDSIDSLLQVRLRAHAWLRALWYGGK